LKTIVTVIAVGLALVGCQSTTPQQTTAQVASLTVSEPHQLTTDELRALFAAPHTAYSVGSYGPKTNVGYFADGKIITRSPQMNDTGVYRITDDGLYCSTFTQLRGGIENCQTIWQIGPDSYEAHLANGRVFKSTHVPGNPEGF
jgi:hypothetical protein